MSDSIAGGCTARSRSAGATRRRPTEFVVYFAEHVEFKTINGRAFVGNTPVFRAKVGDVVQWDVLAIGDTPPHVSRARPPLADRAGLRGHPHGRPAESFAVRWREDVVGTWLYHCHVEDHMMNGMIGIYRVTR